MLDSNTKIVRRMNWIVLSILVISIVVNCDRSIDDDIQIINNEYSISDRINFQDEFDPCYDRLTGAAQRCIPNFENVAYGKLVDASSTCGSPSMDYCVQSSSLTRNFRSSHYSNRDKQCSKCDASDQDSIRSAKYLTDLEKTNATCWVSGPVYNPSDSSNLTLKISFGKKYELTYISLQFCTKLKPDSISILKSMDYGKTWVPFQFYSSDCRNVYNRPLKAKITQANEQEATCTDQHLQSSPFNTNRIGFSTLEGRPSFHEFDTSPVLQDWVTATDIQIVFDRLVSPVIFNTINSNNKNYQLTNTNNSRMYRSRQGRSQIKMQMQNFGYYYAAVSEIAIGGRCKCNGHASRCIMNKYVKYIFVIYRKGLLRKKETRILKSSFFSLFITSAENKQINK